LEVVVPIDLGCGVQLNVAENLERKITFQSNFPKNPFIYLHPDNGVDEEEHTDQKANIG
jgi:hypothetical protein